MKVEGRSEHRPSSVKTYTQVFAEALIEQMREHPEVIAITAAMPDGTGLDKVAKVFPKRMVDVGICEEFAVNFACGLALAGKRPVCAIYSTFLQRAIDQLIHDTAIQHLPVIFALDRGGLVGNDGETHQGVFDLSYLRMIPGFTVMAPRDENELRRMLATAISYTQGPIAFRFPRGNALGVALDEPALPLSIGSWELLREGADCAILAVGHQVAEALSAAQKLAESGTQCSVVNCRFIKPLDEALLRRLVRSHTSIVTAEENVLAGGFGAAVLEWLAAENLRPHVERVGIADEFVRHASQEQQRAATGVDCASIIAAVQRSLGEAPRQHLSVVSG
jgi:1-deoxy-D-xylulose-5-phosphate synthase